MKNMWYLVAAYSTVWLVVGSYLLILMRRNKKLNDTISYLEKRIEKLEERTK